MVRPAQSLPYASIVIILVVVFSTSLAQISSQTVAKPASSSSVSRNSARGDSLGESAWGKALQGDHSVVNLRKISPRLYCGGLPESAADFQQLAELGIKSIVSVDGLRPKVKMAARWGLRYIHLPFGYDGVPKATQLGLVRVAREVQGPIFVHCHHGTHRAPTAAAIIGRAIGDVSTNVQASNILKQAGTSRQYRGLWKSVENFKMPAEKVVLPKLTSVANPGSLAESMARMGHALDLIKESESSGWKSVRSHPDFSAKEQALLIREYLHESGRQLKGKQPDDFLKRLQACEEQVSQLQQQLMAGQSDRLPTTLQAVKKSCSKCHSAYRNGE